MENVVKIEGPDNPWVADGSNYSLTCVVTADIAPEVKWRDGDGNQISPSDEASDSISVSEPVVIGKITRLTLNFSSLRTSQGASYSCLSIISIPSSIQVAVKDVIVKSESVLGCYHLLTHAVQHILHIVSIPHIVPPPVVRMVRQPDITQFFTTDHMELICLTNVNSAVDTSVSVDLTWSGPSGGNVQSDGRVSVLGVQGVLLEYNSTLRFSSLRSSDSGTYTCSSIVTSVPASRFIVTSNSISAVSTVNAGNMRYICIKQ